VGNAQDYHDNLFDARAKKSNFKPRQQQQQQQNQGAGGRRGAGNGGGGGASAGNKIPPQAFYAGEPDLGEWLSHHRDFVDSAIRTAGEEGDESEFSLCLVSPPFGGSFFSSSASSDFWRGFFFLLGVVVFWSQST
jgi:hypothetical protein